MKKINLLLLSSIFVFSNVSFAQTTEVNQVTYKSKTSRFFDKIKPDRISHFSIFAGPNTQFDRNPFNSDGTVNDGGINSWHQVSFQYQISERFRFVINPRFTVDYNQNDARGSKPVISPANPVLGITGTFYKNGRFSWSGGVNTIFWAFGEDDKEEQLLANPGGFQSLNFQVNSKLSVGSWVWARYMVFGNNTSENSDVPLFVSPYVSYSLNDRNAVTAFYQVDGRIENGSQTIEWDRTSDQFNLLYSFSLTKNLTIQPMITVWKETDFDVSRGNINLWLSGRFL